MSMNLCIEVDGKRLDLFQTPTFITNMCLAPNKNGKISNSRAINAYIEYVRSTSSGVFESTKDVKEAKRKANDHIAEVQNAVNAAKKVEVFAV